MPTYNKTTMDGAEEIIEIGNLDLNLLNGEGKLEEPAAPEDEIIAQAYVSLPDLTKLTLFFSFVGLILGIFDTGSDIVSAVFSFLDNDILTGSFTVIVIYLSGIVAGLVWTNISIFGFWDARFELGQNMIENNTEIDIKEELTIIHTPTGYFRFVKSCAIACAIVVIILLIAAFAVIFIPLFIPFILLINFGLQVIYYYRLGEIDPKKRNATIKELRETIDKTTRIDIVKGFCEDAPQTLLQMYVLTTKFETFGTEQNSTRFWITLMTIISSVIGLGLAVAGRWCAILQPYPVMSLYPISMTLLLYFEAITLLLIRTMLICWTTTIVRVLAGSGLRAIGIMLAILGIPRIHLLSIYIFCTFGEIKHQKTRYVWRICIRVISSVLFYPVILYQWILIYMECESIILGFTCMFLYYGDFGVRNKIAFANAIPSWLSTFLLWFGVFIFICNNGIRWTRVIYLFRVNKTAPEKSIEHLFQHLQRVTEILDDWDLKETQTEENMKLRRTLRGRSKNNSYFVRELSAKLTQILEYFHANHPKLNSKGTYNICTCHYRRLLNTIFTEELNRRNELKKTLTRGYKLAEKNSKYKLKNGLLYSELVNLVLMRLLIIAKTIPRPESARNFKRKRTLNNTAAVVEFDKLLRGILTIWSGIYICLPEQFLAKSPEFTFTNYISLLDEDKARSMFLISDGEDEATDISVRCPIKLRTCDLCKSNFTPGSENV